MMEGGNERGIKDWEDIVRALRDGATAQGLYQTYGDRIGELIAVALDRMYAAVDEHLFDPLDLAEFIGKPLSRPGGRL